MAQMLNQAVNAVTGDAKYRQMAENTIEQTKSTPLTTYFGVKVPETDVALRAGARGPTLLEDFHNREKIQHFDHERIPERVVHARGSAAHGEFKLHTPLTGITTAKVLTDTSKVVPAYVRFSTVAGSRGSADTVRDVRGFATRFYTDEGNWDLVGNNIPVFFIQDAIKFPDVIHALKPQPHNEIPQAQTAHDNAWDFISLHQQATHMQQWVTSDRAIPRSYRMMQGFGVHTFRLINEEGKSTFVKYHWIPHLGIHSLVWDEALKVAGQDPDFHRRDLWDAIEVGAYPKWELGVQLIPEEDEHKFDFDILDSTKIIPEELVPVQKIGTLTLNRNPVDFFTEVEQVAFCTQHIVPGMDFTDDPLLAGRNFSYADTQISRLGVNWQDLPINRPICPVMTNFRDGQMSMFSKTNRTPYHPNRHENLPLTSPKNGGFQSYPEKISGIKERLNGPKFNEFYSQATLFWNSMSETEKNHIISAYQFELSHCAEDVVIQNVIISLNEIDHGLATSVHASFPHLTLPEAKPTHDRKSEYLSQINGKHQVFTASGRRIGIYLVPGYTYSQVVPLFAAFEAAGCMVKFIGPTLGPIKASNGQSFTAEFTFEGCRTTFFDAIVFAGGPDDSFVAKLKIGRLIHAVREAYMHLKPIGVLGNATQWVVNTCLPGDFSDKTKTESNVVVENGVVFAPGDPTIHSVQFAKQFLEGVANHRVWDRQVAHIAA
ncbi:catalase [Cryptococcus neoformans C23]|uniref:Catalase n=3 Tax=Cryptococcus neoformans TaxID=5207 RepID=A0A854QFT2_CRYNE|nr:catalase [Cryptococcus neoformans var. grubii H99]ABG26352.1 catalase 1 [Cryptococcus neoformans]AUB23879.1 catalase [Cryptococcus neoformans var. grubii]OWZ33364.1 catalase [Cryptococcus neoformans var. grubii AD2-60a]OWZ45460.1 catalase [Cryptococcus neoformans var. grubii C23]OWZ52843.1 catalase [Cryptococcus neoformans var. grubii 125.91]OXC85521.1 catalase [Cryptococcus neoformans var. grubii AD1-7a]OXG23837.1 catalase [Cryptococcus neoformans var. grubii Tu259-1]OXG36162.1 catalase|eukprot:XP_012048638.1 catalase [Cryptococcus neoformans var. grubii H99]